MDHVEIWNKAKALLREELANVSYTTWIDQPLKPVYCVDDKLALEVISDFNEKTIRARYLSMMTEAVSQVVGREMTIELMSVKERIEWQERQRKEDQPAMKGINMFNPKSTFETFVVGSSNRFAHAASLAVAEAPGVAYNPLFLYGGVGLGKTHLLYAIASVVHKNHPSYNIVYIKGDQFTNELIAALQEGRNNEFRYKYRNADLFLVDDIQFIAGKESTQEEFFHTFNNLYENHHQIVLTADRPPNEMLRLEDRLKTRFEWGLIADIQPPDFETRMAIIKNKSVSLGFDLPNDVCTFIAENVTSNVRLLEGTVKKIRAYHDLDNMELTVPNVSRAIKDMYNKEKAENLPTPNLIIGEVSRFYNIEESVIRGTLKNKNTAEARQVAMYLVRKLTNLSLPDIGKEFGRDHSTVIHSLKKVEQQLAAGTGTLADNIRDITANINSKL